MLPLKFLFFFHEAKWGGVTQPFWWGDQNTVEDLTNQLFKANEWYEII